MRYIDIPPISIIATASSADNYGYWPYPSENDDFWQYGASPRPYQWKLTLAIDEQRHSSKKTRKPHAYNGHDVKIGHYVSDVSSGTTLKIVQILSKTDTTVVCIVEDVMRYNTFRYSSETGIGIFSIPSNVVIFETNEEGVPVIDPMPGSSISFYGNVMSFFQNMEKNSNFIIKKENHGFEIDQIVAIDPLTSDFVLANASYPNIIGSVSYTNLGPDHFAINPIQKIIDNYDFLIGGIGSILYADPMSETGLTESVSGSPVMIKLREWTPSFVVGSVLATNTTADSVFEINRVRMTVADGSMTTFINTINDHTFEHGVAASFMPTPTIAQSSLDTRYGEPVFLTPDAGPFASMFINGVLVTFNVNTVGKQLYGADYAVEEDMATAINSANIPNIVASFSDNNLIITNTAGGSITIVNGTPDAEGTIAAGSGSGTGLPFSTSASSGGYIRLDAIDARAIDLYDVDGMAMIDFGLASAENGQKAAALYIEQGLRSASVNVVMNIAARNALHSLIGDQAYVLDKGDGEWGLYLYDGSVWKLIASQESAKVDSDTYQYLINFESLQQDVIGEVNDGTKVLMVSVTVTEVFDGEVSLTVGDDNDPARLMSADLNDLKSIGSYSSTPTHVYMGGSDTSIKYYLNMNGCTTGAAEISISYS